jgi:hypothetical protein
MTEKTWQTIKVQYCHHVDKQVGLEAEVVYPAEWLPDQPTAVPTVWPATWMGALAASGRAPTRPTIPSPYTIKPGEANLSLPPFCFTHQPLEFSRGVGRFSFISFRVSEVIP